MLSWACPQCGNCRRMHATLQDQVHHYPENVLLAQAAREVAQARFNAGTLLTLCGLNCECGGCVLEWSRLLVKKTLLKCREFGS